MTVTEKLAALASARGLQPQEMLAILVHEAHTKAFSGDRCKGKHAAIYPRTCGICGDPFMSPYPHSKYCKKVSCQRAVNRQYVAAHHARRVSKEEHDAQ